MLETWLQDARFAVRLLRQAPIFTLTAVASLTIGIGANAAIFSAGSALLLRPLPGIAAPERVVDVGRRSGGDGFDTVSYPNYADLRDRATTFSGLYAYHLEPMPVSLGHADGAERIYGTLVSGNYFGVLGAQPHLGRLLRPEDDAVRGEGAVAVLGYDLWTRRFGADAGIVGQQVTLNGFPFLVVGVAPQGFQGTTVLTPDVWMPLSMLTQAMPARNASLFDSRRSTWLFMGGRLKDGVTIDQANAELDAIGTALEAEHPDTNARMRFTAAPTAVVPGMTGILAAFVGLLMGIVGLLLLIACVNLAGMLLARGAARSREMAVRIAIGAPQGRIVRQLLTETAVLFVLGAGAGLLLSRLLTTLLLGVLPQLPVPLFLEVRTDWRVLAFTAVVSLAAAIGCGLVPALQARRTALVPALRTGAQEGGSRMRLRNVFVVAQVTLSLVLVVAAGLFVRALQHAASTPVGFDVRGVGVVSLDLSLARYDAASGRLFARTLLERARALPGVTDAAVAVDLPLDGSNMGFGRLLVPGAPGGTGDGSIPADWNIVEPGYFRTLRMGLIRGRDFTAADTDAAPPVIIVNEAFARAAWGDVDAVGRTVLGETVGPQNERQRYTVVGVAADARLRSVGEAARPFVYAPLGQLYNERIQLLVKSDRASAAADVRALVRSMNPLLPVTSVLPLEDITALGTIPQRIAGAVSAVLGAVGLLLAGMGIYGITAYTVTHRRREIGIRIALGADPTAVLRLMLRQGLRLALTGILLGSALGLAAGQVIRSLLLGVGAADPIVFGSAGLIFGLVALAATYVPARRALAVDPTVSLRSE